MKKRAFLKKVLSLLMVAVMTVGIAPLSGFVGHKLPSLSDFFAVKAEAEETTTYSGTCGENLTWELDTDTGVLTISGTGAMTDYLYSADEASEGPKAPWYGYRSYIQSVVIENGVTSIGGYAFSDCDNLTSVTISDSVTSIGERAFSECDSLTSIEIPSSVTNIGEYALQCCFELENVIFGKNSQLESIGRGAFNGCIILKNIEIPDSVTSIGDHVLYCCTNLESITIGENNANYSNDEYGVLFNKDKTELIQYPIGNTRTSYTIPDSVTSIGDSAFYSCDGLTSITISDSVTTIGDHAFCNCSSLESITFGENSQLTSIDSYAFSDCENLTSITVPKSVTSIGYQALGYYGFDVDLIDGFTIFGYSNSASHYYAYTNGISFVSIGEVDCTSHFDGDYDNICDLCNEVYKTDVEISSSETKTVTVNSGGTARLLFTPAVSGTYSFYSSSDDDTYVYLFDEDMGELAFDDDSGDSLNFNITYDLYEGNIYYFLVGYYDDTSGSFDVTLELTAQHCEHLNTVNVVAVKETCTTNGYTSGVFCNDCQTYISGHEIIMKHHTDTNEDKICDICTEKIKIIDSGSCGENVDYILYDDGELSIFGTGPMDDFSPDSVDDLVPWDNDMVKYVVIEDGVTSIGTSAFEACLNLTNVKIPNSVISIGNSAFYGCINLASIEIPESVTLIHNYAFAGCFSLTSIIIPDSVKHIGAHAFYFCIYLKSVVLGDGIETIEYSAFAYTSLDSIEIPASVEVIGEDIAPDVFFTTNTIQKIIVDEDNPNYSSDENGVLFDKDKTVLYIYPNGKTEKEYIVPDSVKTIASGAFYDLANEYDPSEIDAMIEEIEQELGVEYTGNPNFNTVEVVYIGKNVKVIEEGAFDSSDITDIYYAGSEEEWNEIEIYEDAISETTTIHFDSASCEHENKTFVKYTSHPEHYAVYKCVDCEEEITDTVVNKLEECEECYPECKHTNTYTKITKEPTCTASGTGREICSDCGEIVSVIAIPASHSWGEWKITKTPTDKSEGEKQRVCKACFAVETQTIAKLEKQVEDDKTGVIVAMPEGAYANDIELVVEQQADYTAYEITSVIDGVVNSVVFDITTKVNGEKTQPTTPVIVKIPVPQNFNPNRTFLYHQSGEDYEKINYKIENNYIVFEASQFSYYSLVELGVKSLKIVSAPATTELTYKSDVTADGLKVIAVYSDGSEVDVTENVNITNFDTAEKGDRTATVEFEGKTATFNYTVSYAWWQWIIVIVLLGFIWY